MTCCCQFNLKAVEKPLSTMQRIFCWKIFRRKSVLLLLLGSIIFLTYQYLLWKDSLHLKATSNILRALHNRSTAEMVLPGVRTIQLEPTEKSCEDQGENVFAVFMVTSAPSNREQRDAVRATLGTQLERESGIATKIDDDDVRPKRLKLFFFLGKDGQHDKLVQEEAAIYGDIVVDDFSESYLYLTVKTLRMLKWTLANCRQAKYVVKIDDDVHIHATKFLKVLTDFDNEESDMLVAGHVYQNVPVDTDPSSKWYTPKQLFSNETLPQFTAGFFYTLGLNAADKIYHASLLTTPLFHLEDVFLTGIVANQQLHLKIQDIPNMEAYWPPFYNVWAGSCFIQGYLAIHGVSPDTMRCWSSITTMKSCNMLPAFLHCYNIST